MSRVNTVLGPVPAEELGFVAIHEHIGYGMPGSELDTRWWKSPEQRYEETVPKLRRFHQLGGGTFVDATGICNGRDVDHYKSLSAKTGVHIVACTGFVGGDTALPHFARADVDYLTRQFVHEITVGIGDTGSLAGVIKVGVSRGGRMTDLDKRIYRAAARAALATGVPILRHRGQVSFDITALCPDGTWTPQVTKEDLLRTVEGFDERLVDITRGLDMDTVNIRAVYDIDPVGTWHSDSVVLVGDAAHSMLHHQGQGANSAIEDAGAIADALREAGSVKEGLALYQATRKPVTDKLQAISRQGWTEDEINDVFPGQKPAAAATGE
ncbi:hypothetical protein GCM10010377_05990 [Streptomyces viridiviolaceus]|uniref:FAD-dependent monooxygenase n=1 Tax=Streptomyces viridiviolaceus TaxID=68282 RepID=A0ABW2E0R6_9ACTN|nr:FAD-dependent monooxygenase [Streptomyces viridiviolaceus]GHB19007.1 hypothetical protein GCM10010377_05990 [Streptomyces viridiviolaceus]